MSVGFKFSLKNCDKKSVAQILFRIRSDQLFREFVFLLRLAAALPLGHALVHLPLLVDGRVAHYVGNNLKVKNSGMLKSEHYVQ